MAAPERIEAERRHERTEEIVEQVVEAEEAIGAAEVAEEVETAEDIEETFEELTPPPMMRFKEMPKASLDDMKVRFKKAEEARLAGRLAPADEIESSAERFARQNKEFNKEVLKLLLEKIKDCRTKEEIRSLVDQFYHDPTLADDALAFLIEATRGELQKATQEAREAHNLEFGREIAAGKHIQEEVFKAAAEKLGAPTTLRDLYRDITGNPREPVTLFLELSDRFTYQDMRKVLAFLFHSLGADLRSQGPSIDPGLLFRLLSETRSLQAILGVYQFFRSRMRLIKGLFARNGLEMPARLSFELLARQFVNLLQERYPTGEKVLVTAGRLGIEKWIIAKIIIFSQLRDAIREVALHKLYRSIDHRNELYNALIEALESLEDELDELLEREEEEEEEGGEKKKKHGEEEEEEEEGTGKTKKVNEVP
jgi:type III secretion protein W